MHLAIEAAGTEDRGGAVVLREFLEACQAHPDVTRVSLYASSEFEPPEWSGITHHILDVPGAVAKVRWALWGWNDARRASGAHAALSFNGFSYAEDQSVFVHNALCFDRAADLMSASQRGRLAILREFTLQASRRANRVIVQTNHMASYLKPYPRIRGKVAQVLHGRKLGAARGESTFTTTGKTRVLYVGSELPFKDTDTLYGALSLLPGTECILIGNWEPLEVHPNAKWIGHVPQETLWAHYRDADVVVVTSLCESLGLPLLEAMAAGVPLVAPDLPYAREVCGDAAIYFRPSDRRDCAAAIQKALQPDELEKLIEHGTRRTSELLERRGMNEFIQTVLGF